MWDDRLVKACKDKGFDITISRRTLDNGIKVYTMTSIPSGGKVVDHLFVGTNTVIAYCKGDYFNSTIKIPYGG